MLIRRGRPQQRAGGVSGAISACSAPVEAVRSGEGRRFVDERRIEAVIWRNRNGARRRPVSDELGP